tara:strand:+ start:114 stop:236 length:123 start_codon:yes stop_codon:yes gene_type:complete
MRGGRGEALLLAVAAARSSGDVYSLSDNVRRAPPRQRADV